MKKPEIQWKLISPHYSFYWRFFVNLRKKNLLLPLLTAVKWAKSIKTVQLKIVEQIGVENEIEPLSAIGPRKGIQFSSPSSVKGMHLKLVYS